MYKNGVMIPRNKHEIHTFSIIMQFFYSKIFHINTKFECYFKFEMEKKMKKILLSVLIYLLLM